MTTTKAIKPKKKGKWWEEGIRFECQGSGNCCLSRGQYGYVYLTQTDRKKMSESLGLTLQDFTKKYCEFSDGLFHLKNDSESEECLFLKKNRCTVYSARPTQCKTWPFWPENMNAKSWNKEVKSFCPGVGKGPIVPASQIREALNEQVLSETEMGMEPGIVAEGSHQK